MKLGVPDGSEVASGNQSESTRAARVKSSWNEFDEKRNDTNNQQSEIALH